MTEVEQKIVKIAAEEAPKNTNAKQVLSSVKLILQECASHGITSKNQLAYVLATVHHESCLGAWMREFADGTAYENRDDLGNNQPGDGPRYKGRGFVQLTGRSNYTKYAAILKIDLVGNPELAAEPPHAAKILAHGMANGAYTGRKLASYEKPDGSYDFVGARWIVNGQDKAEQIAAKARRYLTALNSSATGSVETAKAASRYRIVIPAAKATVRSGPGRSFAIVTTLNANATRQYQVDSEISGEAIGSDNIWLHLPEAGGYVTRTAVKRV